MELAALNLPNASELTRIDLVPREPLHSLLRYSVVLPEGAVVDGSGNAFAGFAEGDWVFQVRDVEAPRLRFMTPAHMARGVLPNTTVTLHFSEPVLRAMDTSVELVPVGNSPVILLHVLSPFDVKLSSDGTNVTLHPPERLALEEEYMVRVPPGAFEDLAGNPFPGFTGNLWFVTADVTPPLLVARDPPHGSRVPGASSGTQLVVLLRFNERIRLLADCSLIVTCNDGSCDEVVEGHGLSAAQDSMFVHLPAIQQRTAVRVVVPPLCVEDEEGNIYRGLGVGEYSFTVEPGAGLNRESAVALPDGSVASGAELDYTFSTAALGCADLGPLRVTDGGWIKVGLTEGSDDVVLVSLRGVAPLVENVVDMTLWSSCGTEEHVGVRVAVRTWHQPIGDPIARGTGDTDGWMITTFGHAEMVVAVLAVVVPLAAAGSLIRTARMRRLPSRHNARVVATVMVPGH